MECNSPPPIAILLLPLLPECEKARRIPVVTVGGPERVLEVLLDGLVQVTEHSAQPMALVRINLN